METPFLGKSGSKNQNCQIKLKFEYAKFNGAVHFFGFIQETSFLVNEGKQSAIIVSATLGSRDFQVGNCYQHGFFIFFNNLKPKQTFYFHA